MVQWRRAERTARKPVGVHVDAGRQQGFHLRHVASRRRFQQWGDALKPLGQAFMPLPVSKINGGLIVVIFSRHRGPGLKQELGDFFMTVGGGYMKQGIGLRVFHADFIHIPSIIAVKVFVSLRSHFYN